LFGLDNNEKVFCKIFVKYWKSEWCVTQSMVVTRLWQLIAEENSIGQTLRSRIL
jgi:hypothetical protein